MTGWRLNHIEPSTVHRLLRNLGGTRAGHDESLLEYEISLVPDPAHDYGIGEFIAAGRL